MKWSYLRTTIILFFVGLLLAFLKIIYLFFPLFNITDILVFFGTGYLLGKNVAGGHWLWGLVLAIPCLILDSSFVYKQGYSNIVSGIGTGFLISLFLVPISACLGIARSVRKDHRSTA